MSNSSSARRPRVRQLLAVMAVAGLVAAGCSNSDDDDGGGTASASNEETASAPETTVAPEVTEPASVEETASSVDDTTPETTAPTQATEASTPDVGEFQPIEGVPGVTDEQIQVAVLGTGPSNPLGYCLLECFQGGVQAYFDYYNSLGGVHGRELVINRVEDDQVGNNQTKAIELVAADDVFAVFAAPLLFNGFGEFGASDVPVYTTPPAAADANTFENIYLPYGTFCGTCPRKLTVQNAILAGGTKAASIGFGESQSSKDCANNNKATFDRWGPDVGIEFVYLNDTLSFGFPNGVGPEVTAMKDAGVDYIVTCIDVSSALLLEQELERQGMTDVVVALPQGYGDDEFISTNADLLEGDILSVSFQPFETAVEGDTVSRFLDWMDQGGYEVTDNAMYGWMGATLFVEGLLAAGPQFDRAGLVGATNAITDYTAGGIVQPTDWSRQHTAPTIDDPVTNAPSKDCQAFMIVRGGVLEVAGDPATPFWCIDPTVPEWQDAVATSFVD